MIAAHADWSLEPRKRWVTLARRQGRGWQASAPRLVGDPATLAAALIAEGGTAALGLDLPLGVPRGFAANRPEQGFPAFLAGLAQTPDFFAVSPTLETGRQRDVCKISLRSAGRIRLAGDRGVGPPLEL